MLLVPPVLFVSLLALVATVALAGAGLWLIYAWGTGVVVGTGYLVAGLALVVWTVCGRRLLLPFLGRTGRDGPRRLPGSGAQRLQRPDGTELHVEQMGPRDAPAVVLTHGWGMTNDDWYYVKRVLGSRYRLIVWDLRGHGQSSRSPANDYSVETMAGDLEAVVHLAGDGPVVLAGHSIGGMISLTYCRRFPEALRRRVAGLALVNTTYTNPVRTTTLAGFFAAIQKPILEPLLHVVIWTSPVVGRLNWLSYLNGTGLIVSRLTGFAGTQTRGQLDFSTRLSVEPAPATLARGVLGMFRYDATDVLPGLDVPALVVTGDRDRILVPQASREMAAALPDATLLSLTPAGHMGVYERHGELVAALDAFVVRCAAPAVPAPVPAAEMAREDAA